MKIKRLTERKDHLVAEGKASVTNMIDGSAIVLSVEQDKGSCASHYNRAIFSINEAMAVSWGLFKVVAKLWLKNKFKTVARTLVTRRL